MDIEAPIFIFCQHRTGSTLLRNMLDLHSEVAMTDDEMVVLSPWHRTLFDLLKEHNLDTKDGLSRGLERVYNCEAYGPFWRYFSRQDIPMEGIMAEVENGERSAWGVVDAFLKRIRDVRKKRRAGGKNFAHFSHLPQVVTRYEDAKCIFLVRDPEAMCASKLKSLGTRERKSKSPRLAPLIHLVTLLFFLWEYRRMARSFRKFRRSYEILCVRYEDLVNHPSQALLDVCKFCELPFEEAMLEASGKESSHTGATINGVDSSRVKGGVGSLQRWERWLIRATTARARLETGYQTDPEIEAIHYEGSGYTKGY